MSVAALALLFAACGGSPPDTTPAGQIRALVSSVRHAPVLSQAVLEEIFEAPFTLNKETENRVSLEARPSGPFDRVELRQSRSKPWRLVVLNVRPDVHVPFLALRNDPIPTTAMETAPSPHVPLDSELGFVVTDPHLAQKVYFVFPRSRLRLTSVAFHRDFD